MVSFISFLKRNRLIFLFIATMVIIIGGGAYFSAIIGVGSNRSDRISAEIPTTIPPLEGTSVARYFQINPSIITYLDFSQPSYSIMSADPLGLDIQQVGVYLPVSGNTQFELTEPTQLPTPLPYATSNPLPLPTVEPQILPTITPTPAPRVFAASNAANPPAPASVPVVPFTEGATGCAPSGKPAQGVLTQRYHIYHSGIDIGVPLGTPVLATHSGEITFTGWSEIGYGYLVTLQNGAFITYYAHNTSFNVTQGQFVGKGSIIAWSGSTGNSSGPHIHYETRINDIPVDPLTFENRGYSTC